MEREENGMKGVLMQGESITDSGQNKTMPLRGGRKRA
jgi:hypothetical protein